MNNRLIPVEWLPQYTYADYEAWEGDWELIEGIPYSLMPSPKRTHQATGRNFIRLAMEALKDSGPLCNCDVFYELDWIVDNTTVVRPDALIVCGKFNDDFLRFPPSLIIEITSRRTQMTDRNVKYKLYESQQAPYYIIADPDRKAIDVFELQNGRYQMIETTSCRLAGDCATTMDLSTLWR